jgi:predicted site-specific integrase-resolvase
MSSIKHDYDVDRVARALGVSLETARRWLREGLLTRDGRRVRLAGRRIGKRWSVAPEAVEAFIAQMTADAIAAPLAAAVA